MQLLQPFNPSNYDPTQSAGQLPVGKHPVIIDGHEITATKAGDGGLAILNLAIIDGPMKGSSGVYRLNLYNQSQVACEIAHKQLSAICHVTGMAGTIITDLSQLHNKQFYVQVGVQKNNPEYTQIEKVFDINGNEPGKVPVQQQQVHQGFVQPQQPAQQQQNAFQQPVPLAGQPNAAWPDPNAGQQQQTQPQQNSGPWPGAAVGQQQAAPPANSNSVPPWLQNK